ncbi:hypothetical protein HID58_018373 [Brassica napus]|uniref:Leucine-rich repeat-containing N-terminal plant-type domain-containing protein n=1 Tax=Brassica napus TaxID=3708 RepID=A0ABQ8D9T1_BRANA|nr:hypothetical protein HID58_018373 [Brassica napus]
MASIYSLLFLSLLQLHCTLSTGNNHIIHRKSLEIISGSGVGGIPPPLPSPQPKPEECPPPCPPRPLPPQPEECPPPPPPPCPPPRPPPPQPEECPPPPPPPCPPPPQPKPEECPPPPPLPPSPPPPPPPSPPPTPSPKTPPLPPPESIHSPPKAPPLSPSEPSRSPPKPPKSPPPPQLTFASPLLKKVYPVLQAFKKLVEVDSKNILASWNGSDICGKYRGLECATFPGTKYQAVASVQFNGFNFSGKNLRLDNFLDKLDTVTIFHANSNNFLGSVPKVSNLKYLFELDLSNNKLTGEFPASVLKATNLTFLDLRFNTFSGSVPRQVFNLDLDVLFINNNNLVQKLPHNLGSITALYLTFANNRPTQPESLLISSSLRFAPVCLSFFSSPFCSVLWAELWLGLSRVAPGKFRSVARGSCSGDSARRFRCCWRVVFVDVSLLQLRSGLRRGEESGLSFFLLLGVSHGREDRTWLKRGDRCLLSLSCRFEGMSSMASPSSVVAVALSLMSPSSWAVSTMASTPVCSRRSAAVTGGRFSVSGTRRRVEASVCHLHLLLDDGDLFELCSGAGFGWCLFATRLSYSFGCLDKMEQLNLARNKFFGTIPEIVCEISSLKNLSLSYNFFTQVGPKCRNLIKRNILDVRMNCILDLPNQKTPLECANFFMRKHTCPNSKSMFRIPCGKNPNRIRLDQEQLKDEQAQTSSPVSYWALNPDRIQNR